MAIRPGAMALGHTGLADCEIDGRWRRQRAQHWTAPTGGLKGQEMRVPALNCRKILNGQNYDLHWGTSERAHTATQGAERHLCSEHIETCAGGCSAGDGTTGKKGR